MTDHRLLLAGATALLALGLAGTPARAAEDGTDHDAILNEYKETHTWGGFTEAKAMAPRWGLPFELEPGIPYTRVLLDATPGHCEAFGNVYYESEGAQEGFLETTDKYENPAQVRVFYPAAEGQQSKGELTPIAPEVGPSAAAECVHHMAGTARGAFNGFGNEQVRFDSATTDSVATVDRATGTYVQESTARFRDVSVGDTLRVSAFESWMKVETRPDAEPVISYRLSLEGVSNGAERVAGVDHATGVFFSGSQLVPPAAIEQFRAQAFEQREELAALAGYGVKVFAPSVTKEGSNYLITSPVLDAELRPTAREGGVLEFVGFRFGHIRTRVSFVALDSIASPEPGPSAITGTPVPEPTRAAQPGEATGAPAPAPAPVAPMSPRPYRTSDPDFSSPATGVPAGDYTVGGEEALSETGMMASPPSGTGRLLATPASALIGPDGASELADGFRAAILVLVIALGSAVAAVQVRLRPGRPGRSRS